MTTRKQPFSGVGRFTLFGIALPAIVAVLCCGTSARAQSGLRATLEQLDVNQNGEIDPDEVTPLARPYLERIAQSRRLSLDRPNGIDQLQEAARIYHALQNGVAGKDVRAESKGTVQPFGPDRDRPVVPEFGLGEMKYRYTLDDLEEADRTLQRYDRDQDGTIDQAEAERAKWTHRNPFDDDLNLDDRLSRLELVQRYARRRLLSGASSELVQKARRVGNGIRPTTTTQRSDQSQWWKQGGSNYWLTAAMMGRFDANRNGRLEPAETVDLGLPVAQVDIDRDGTITRDELYAYVSAAQNEAGNELDGLPGWFFELDVNQDDQVALAEFATDWDEQKIFEFTSLDTNDDGLLTAAEVAGAKSVAGGEYSNEVAEVLPPGRTVISEIDVDADYLIGDLNVAVSITHSNVGFLDAYLTGPDGQRIELFTDVGGAGDHFDGTIFDDQAKEPIVKGRPPFAGTFLPEGLLRREPGLSVFNGKQVRGVWQLVVRGTRSERFGMLHGWTLMVTPVEQMLGGSAMPATYTSSPGSGGPSPASYPPARSQAASSSETGRSGVKPNLENKSKSSSMGEKQKATKQKATKQIDWERVKREKNLSDEDVAKYKRMIEDRRRSAEQGKPRSEERGRSDRETPKAGRELKDLKKARRID